MSPDETEYMPSICVGEKDCLGVNDLVSMPEQRRSYNLWWSKISFSAASCWEILGAISWNDALVDW